MGRFARGMQVLDRTVSLLRQKPSLFLLPAASTLAVLFVLGLPLAAALATDTLSIGTLADALANRGDPLRYALLIPAMFLGTTVATFFNAALAHCTRRLLAGEGTSLRDGLGAAWAVRRRIVAYSLVTASIGLVIQVLDDVIPAGGRLTGMVLDLGWGLLTFFVVPVLVLEDDVSVRGMFEQSGRAFADTWGETLSANVGIGLVVFVAGVVPLFVVAGIGLQYAGLYGALFGVILVLAVISTVSSALGMVVRTMLYVYATDGEEASGLDGLDPRAMVTK